MVVDKTEPSAEFCPSAVSLLFRIRVEGEVDKKENTAGMSNAPSILRYWDISDVEDGKMMAPDSEVL